MKTISIEKVYSLQGELLQIRLKFLKRVLFKLSFKNWLSTVQTLPHL